MKREYVIYECDRCETETDPNEQSWSNAKPPNGWMVFRLFDPYLGPDGAARYEGLLCKSCVGKVRDQLGDTNG